MLEIRTLEYFLAIAREGNMSRAAEALHITQPTLSRQMAQLERKLGTRLFERGRSMKLTPAGTRLKHRAEDIVSLARATERELRQGDEIEGTVTIGTGGFASSRLLATAIETFHEKNPRVHFDFYVNSTEYVEERLEQGLLDFGVLLEPIDRRRFEHESLGVEERWGLLVRRGDPIAGKDAATPADLLSAPLMTTADADLQTMLGGWAGMELDRLDVVCTYNVVTNVAPLVDHGVARALTIEGAVGLLDPGRFAFLPLDPALAQRTAIAWRKSGPASRSAAAFLEHLKNML